MYIYIVTTLHVPHSLAVPPGSVEVETVVSGEGPVEAGSGGPTLTCTVRETISGLTNMPSALWVGPSGHVEDGERVTLTGTTSDVTATLNLTFPSLLTSQAGGYTCQGTVVTPVGVDDVTITSTPPHYVTVSCKYHVVCVSTRGWSSLFMILTISTTFCIPYLLSTVSVSLPVPMPSVSLSVPSGPLYEGTSQTLTCTVTLPEPVDTDVTVGVVWRFTDTPVAPSARVQISPVSSTRSPFTSTLTLSPLNMSDAGQFSCEATADSAASQYITASSLGESQDRTVTVEGMLLNVMTSSAVLTIISSSFSSACTSCQYLILWILYCWSELFPAVFS